MRVAAALLIVFAGLSPVSAAAPADMSSAAWAALERPGAVALMRHALAPGTGDPPNFRLDDCSTQRNLSPAGRAQARAVGRAFADRGIAVSRILTSQWCRCRDTATGMAAELDDPPVEDFPPLNSFFRDRSTEPQQTAAVEAFLAERAADGGSAEAGTLVLVTHFVNVRALTGVGPRSGEIVVAEPDGTGRLTVLGRIRLPAR